MKKLSIIGLVLMLFLTACTHYMYGVPQETWDQMSEPERIDAMRIYEREQQARRKVAEERARQQAVERERERVRQVEAERARLERIEAIHRGDGAYGELLRVRLQGGKIKVGDQHHRYEPITFTIADGEISKIEVVDRKGRATILSVTYGGGALSFDGLRFPYDRSWGRGKLYADTGTSGALQLRGVDVFVEVHGRSLRHERELPRLVIIHEEPPRAPRPSAPVVAESVKPLPPTVAVNDHNHLRPPPERPPHTLEVVLLSGEMKVQGRNHNVERATLRLADGETRNFAVRAGDTTGNLSITYRKGELFINGSPGSKRDGVRLTFEKEWKAGKVYRRLDLKGKAHLENVEIKVTGIEWK